MPLTLDERADLEARLDQLVGEYAAASQKSEAVAKMHGLLDRATEAAPAAVADAPAEHSDT